MGRFLSCVEGILASLNRFRSLDDKKTQNKKIKE
jgi:hypothetical protein